MQRRGTFCAFYSFCAVRACGKSTMSDYLDRARTRLAELRTDNPAVVGVPFPTIPQSASKTRHHCAESVESAESLSAMEAEYERLGEQVDALFDEAQAARARGAMAEGERLGSEVRALVVGPYLRAREHYAALLNPHGEEGG